MFFYNHYYAPLSTLPLSVFLCLLQTLVTIEYIRPGWDEQVTHWVFFLIQAGELQRALKRLIQNRGQQRVQAGLGGSLVLLHGGEFSLQRVEVGDDAALLGQRGEGDFDY